MPLCNCRSCKGKSCICKTCELRDKCLYYYTLDCRWEETRGGSCDVQTDIRAKNAG